MLAGVESRPRSRLGQMPRGSTTMGFSLRRDSLVSKIAALTFARIGGYHHHHVARRCAIEFSDYRSVGPIVRRVISRLLEAPCPPSVLGIVVRVVTDLPGDGGWSLARTDRRRTRESSRHPTSLRAVGFFVFVPGFAGVRGPGSCVPVARAVSSNRSSRKRPVGSIDREE